MRIMGIPKSNKDSASCRIRFFAFLEATGQGWEYYRGKIHGDVLYIQKTTDKHAAKAARSAKRYGMRVVYDMDDVRKDWASKGYDQIIESADAVTTDTEERAEVIRSHTNKPVFVVPDCIDYGIVIGETNILRGKPQYGLVTFGHNSTVRYAEPYMAGLNKISHISNKKVKGLGRFIEWNRKTFVNNLSAFDYAFLAHKPGWQGDCKSINRLLVCMALGLPTIVTKTSAYESAMNAIGLSNFCVGSKDELAEKVQELAALGIREDMVGRFREFAQEYTPDKSAKKLMEVFNETATS